jgi:hypothetical protein
MPPRFLADRTCMRRGPLACVLALLLGSAAGSGGILEAPPVAAWADLVGSPGRSLGETRRVFVQFQELEESWNPYLTRFSPQDYFAVRGWTDEERPWLREDYEDPRVRVFVPRGGESETLLRAARPHERYELVLAIREHCAGELWCQVLSARRLKKEIPEGSVLGVARALDLMDREAWDLAASELQRALAAPLPEAAREEVVEMRDHVRRMSR